ncbi:hypothetical protein [Prevotella sp.]|uniref:hypothetical protein n=1 Tax=Prevotella sp. TaxID=59823 RepID=UPI0025EE9C84|nr:hypothetical protein [Prevotella sp.]
MDEIIKSLYLRLDANTSTLTRSAIGQILVKIIYSLDGLVSKEDIFKAYAQINGIGKTNEQQLEEILEELVDKDIKKRSGKYYLSSSKKAKIAKSVDIAENRKEEILDKYFSNVFSDRTLIEEWLQDVTIKFFESFSDEWISDLLTGHKDVYKSESSIRDMVDRRTLNNKKIDDRDKKVLPKLFFEFVNDNTGAVNDYLWDYGTSAFAAKLIRNQNGVDSLTIDSFKNSTCILDTNVLLFISLNSRFKDGIIALENVFSSLNVKVGYLYITQKEYQDKVYNQKSMTMRNLEKFGYDIASIPNDDFTTNAKELQCKTSEDFERFFDEKHKMPKVVHESLPIKLLDNDSQLVNVVEEAQHNQNKIDELNGIFHNCTGHDKRPNALIHDIGLLEGVEYLRKNGKYFVVSEEVCVNLYSKKRPLSDNLPLSIRIDTLINVLAANNDGDTFNAADYVPLFANIVRSGLIPNKNTFKQEELYFLYDIDEQVAQLPKEEVEEIVMDMHEMILKGTGDKELERELKSKITKGKIKVVSDLDSTKQALSLSEKNLKRQEEQNQNLSDALRRNIWNSETQKYDEETVQIKKKYQISYPFVVFLISVIAFIFAFFNTDTVGSFLSFVISLLVNVIYNWYCRVKVLKDKINDRLAKRESVISRAVTERMNKEIGIKE